MCFSLRRVSRRLRPEGDGDQSRSGRFVARTSRGGEDGEFEKRFVKKLGVGALIGTVPLYVLGAFLTSASGAEGLGAGVVFDFTVALGYPVAAAIGVSLVDPHDRFIHSLAGSAAGFVVGAYIPRTKVYQFSAFRWDVIWNWFVGFLVGATVLSEKFRKPPESQRFSVGLKPDPRGHLLAVASWRF